MTNFRPSTLPLGFVILFFSIFLFVFLPYVNEKPRGIHQWAQGDRLSITERYIEGRGLFDPATLSMKSDEGKVGVEFSGYQYLIAQLVRSNIVDRAYLPFISRFISFLFFFTIFYLIGRHYLKEENLVGQITTLGALLTSPIILFYSYNFLPDILALGLVLWGLFLFDKGLDKNIFKILLILGLALFIKTSSGIYFIAVFAVFFLIHIRKPNKKLFVGLLVFLLIAVGVAYHDYVLINLKNKKLYSYVFLSGTRTVRNWAEFWEIFTTARRFKMEYFTGIQWVVLLSILGYSLTKIKRWNKDKNYQRLCVLVLIGLLAIIVMFGVQYKDHDYYVLGTFMPLILFTSFKVLKNIYSYIHPYTVTVLSCIFFVVSFTQGSNRYFNRMSETVWINGTMEHYEKDWLTNAHIKIKPYVHPDEYVYVVYVPEPNFALTYIERKGATFNAEEMARDNDPFSWFMREQNVSYVVCKTAQIDQFKKDKPDFFNYATVVYNDDKLTLLKQNGY